MFKLVLGQGFIQPKNLGGKLDMEWAYLNMKGLQLGHDPQETCHIELLMLTTITMTMPRGW